MTNLLKDWKLHSIALTLIIVCEMVGARKIGIIMVFPMLYAMIIGGVISFPKFKILSEQNMKHANSAMGVASIILIAKLGMSVGPNLHHLYVAKGAFIVQELGHFLGTIVLGMPIALMMGLKREAVGATFSAGRETSIIIVDSKYGLDSPEGRGVMAVFICGTLFGAIWMTIMASVIAKFDIIHPLALAMGAGIGSSSMMSAAIAPLMELYPAQSNDIKAYAATANLLTNIVGIYIYIFFSLPFTSWLYNFITRNKRA